MAHLMVPNAVDGIFSLAALQWAPCDDLVSDARATLKAIFKKVTLGVGRCQACGPGGGHRNSLFGDGSTASHARARGAAGVPRSGERAAADVGDAGAAFRCDREPSRS